MYSIVKKKSKKNAIKKINKRINFGDFNSGNFVVSSFELLSIELLITLTKFKQQQESKR